MSIEDDLRERAAAVGPLRRGTRNENPKGISFLRLLAEDLETHSRNPFAPGFVALLVHRFGNKRMDVRSPLFRAPLTVAYWTAHKVVLTVWGIDLPYVSRIGRRLRIDHHGAVFLGAWSTGNDVVIRHTVTVGLARKYTVRAPIIGDRVELGPGACVVGDIVVGDDCYVAANTVLGVDLPPGTAAIGVPARQTSKAELLGGD
jgi:serine O-acetyltransferase